MNPEHEKDEANKDDDAKIKAADLSLEEAQGDEVKGGPIYMKYGDVMFMGPPRP